MLGEPPSIELANTVFAVRGHRTEGLATPQDVARWLQGAGFAVGRATARDVESARRLRTAIRTIAGCITQQGELDASAVATLNAYAASPPRWRELAMQPTLGIVQSSLGRPVEAAFGAIADNAIEVFGGPLREQLRACPGPNCILYFLSDGRREWCSKQCGNRARAARHYAKTRRMAHGPAVTSIGD